MFELDDVGRDVALTFRGVFTDYQAEVKIEMVIKSPKGTMALLQNKDDNIYNRHIGDTPIDGKRRAIKAFMEEHKDDTTN